MSVSVSIARAAQIATARIAQLDQAIAVLDPATLATTLLIDMRSVWENVPAFIADRPAEVEPEEFIDALRRSCFDLAQKHRADPAMQAQVIGWVEIASMLRTDYLAACDRIRATAKPTRITEFSRIHLDRPASPEEDQ